MKIGIDCGHTLTGADTGAQGCGFREENKTREIGAKLMNLLIQEGHTIVDCTLDNCNDLGESLSHRVDTANASNADVFISIHLNAYNCEVRGVEVHVAPDCSQASLDYASKVKTELCKLGYVDRGVKQTNLYVCKHTSMPAILVECGFIDNTGDMALYNADKIASAIATGITGQVVLAPVENIVTPMYTEPSPASVIVDSWIGKLQTECNNQGFSDQVVDGIFGPNTLAGCPLLKIGAEGNITRLLQEKLEIDADGDFGNQTRQSVIDFQDSNGLVADGIVGQATWSKLLGM